MPDQAPGGQAREFAAAFRGFLEWIHSPAAGAGEGNEMAARWCTISSGLMACTDSVVTRELLPFEHVNLQIAVDAWSAPDGRSMSVTSP